MPPPLLTFTTFPKLRSGDGDEGADVLLDGHRIGSLVREIDWRNVGVLQPFYRAKILAYRVELWALDEDDRVFDKLGYAKTFVRTQVLETLDAQHAMIAQRVAFAAARAAKAGKAAGRKGCF